MNRTLQRLWRRSLRQFGPLGMIAVFCLLVALLIGAWTPQLIKANEALSQEARRLAAKPPTAAPARVVRQVPLSEQLGEFLGDFPTLSQNPEDLRKVFLSADAHRIKLPKGEYLFKNEANTPLLTVTVSLPIEAEYAAIKAFSAEVLASVPNASMDELRMTREAAGSKVLETLVRFSFVYRKP